MSTAKEFTGNDVPQAILKACEELKVKQDQLDIDVVAAGSNGIFGMFGKKKARINVTLKKTGEKQKEGRGHKSSHPRKSRPFNVKKKSGRKPRREEKPPAEITPAHLDKIKSNIETILNLMGYPGTVTVSNEGNRIKGHIDNDHIEEITGTEGQVLDSIQYLMRKIISKMIEGKVLFSLDAGNYRQERKKDLEERALRLAEEVKETGRTKSIPAINPSERRIVHMTLQDDTSIRSRSIGDGHFKKILIYVPGRGRKKKK